MTENSVGFILREIRYGDTSSIVKVYTKEHGLRSFMVKGLRSSRSKHGKVGLFPLLEIEFSYIQRSESQNLCNILQFRPHGAYKTLYGEVSKSCMLTFLAEILSKCFAEGQPDCAIYGYINRFLENLDNAESSYGYYHLLFLFEISRFLGCYPNIGDYDILENKRSSAVFDLREGVFSYSMPAYEGEVAREENGSELLRLMLSEPSKAEEHLRNMSAKEKNSVLVLMMNYYKIQLSMPEIKSYQVFREVFSHV